jgi:hypothetical protein
MDIQEVLWGMDWIDLAQSRNRLWALVNAAMNLLQGISCLAENRLALKKE